MLQRLMPLLALVITAACAHQPVTAARLPSASHENLVRGDQLQFTRTFALENPGAGEVKVFLPVGREIPWPAANAATPLDRVTPRDEKGAWEAAAKAPPVEAPAEIPGSPWAEAAKHRSPFAPRPTICYLYAVVPSQSLFRIPAGRRCTYRPAAGADVGGRLMIEGSDARVMVYCGGGANVAAAAVEEWLPLKLVGPKPGATEVAAPPSDGKLREIDL